MSTNDPNNTVILINDNRIIQITKMESAVFSSQLEEMTVHGRLLKITGPALDYPPGCSKVLNMYCVEVPDDNQKSSQTIVKFNASEIKTKMVLLKIFEISNDSQEWYVVPLIHSL